MGGVISGFINGVIGEFLVVSQMVRWWGYGWGLCHFQSGFIVGFWC
jgi:hypothetical protein